MEHSGRFWARVAIGEPDDCWEWQGSRHERGYGRVRWDGRIRGAHRVAWVLFGLELADSDLVLHLCDNPPCCNPGHLYLGTHRDNAKDLGLRGRHERGGCEHQLARAQQQADYWNGRVSDLSERVLLLRSA